MLCSKNYTVYVLSLAELYFLIQWEEKDQDDGESLFDVLPSKSIIVDYLLAVVKGQAVSARFKYPASIVGKGMP